MKHIPPVNLGVIAATTPTPKRAERPVSAVAFMADEERTEEETAPVGSATDGGRRNTQGQSPGHPEQNGQGPKPDTAPAAKPGQAIGSPPLIAGNAGTLAALLQLQEEAAPEPRKPLDPDADWEP